MTPSPGFYFAPRAEVLSQMAGSAPAQLDLDHYCLGYIHSLEHVPLLKLSLLIDSTNLPSAPMASITYHACNREAAPGDILFRNETNSVSEIRRIRLETQLQQQAAREQQKLLEAAVEDKEEIKKERDLLRDEKSNLDTALKNLQEAKEDAARAQQQNIQNLTDEIQHLKSSNQSSDANTLRVQEALDGVKKELETEVGKGVQLAEQVENLKQENTQLGVWAPRPSQRNCLPLALHGKTVLIVNARSQLALDAGRGLSFL